MTPRLALACALLAAAALALGACGSGGGNGGEAAAEETGGPPTPAEAYSEIIERIAKEGSSPALALELFTVVYGDLPDVKAPETQDGPGVPSGTGVLRTLSRHFDELTEVERQAVDHKLGFRPEEGAEGAAPKEDAGASAAVLASYGATRLAQADPAEAVLDARLDPDLTQEGREIADEMAQRMGISYSTPTYVGKLDPGVTYRADTYGYEIAAGSSDDLASVRWRRNDSRLSNCVVRLRSDLRGEEAESTLAHEIYHCLHLERVGGVRNWGQAASWIAEGSAEWAGEAWVGELTETQELRSYLDKRKDLLWRGYPAVGFWAQLNGALEGSLWGKLPELLEPSAANGNGIAAFRRAVANQSGPGGFLDEWAPQTARRPGLGSWWELDLHELRTPAGPGAPVERVDRVDLERELADHGEELFTTPERTRTIYEFQMPGPDSGIEKLTINLVGYGRTAWPGARPGQARWLTGKRVDEFCLLESEACKSRSAGVPLLPSDTLTVGIVGLAQKAEILFSSAESCPQARIETGTPEHAICAHLEETRGKGDIYEGDCRRGPPSSYKFCSHPPGPAASSASEYLVTADDADIYLRLRRSGSDSSWRVVGERVVQTHTFD